MAARRSLGWGLALALTAMGAALALRAGGEGARRDGRRRAGAGRGAPAEEEAVDGKIERTEAEWREILTPEQFRIMRRRGTERPFTGRYCHHDAEGLYRCAGCGQALFDAATKYASGSGWPSFKAPRAAGHVEERPDASLSVPRTEVVCSRCDAHLGHVFDDGPAPTGRRYCINSAALDFEPAQETRKAMFGAGCFWGVEAAFRQVEGVVETAVGYSGGWKESPTYEEVCTDRTGHAEVVLVTYDPKRVPYETLLEVFWRCHDPTQRNRQGPDAGRQYRSVIFTFDESQRRTAEISREALTRSGRCKRPIATEIEKAGPFWRAEEYHQRFYEKTGRRACAR